MIVQCPSPNCKNKYKLDESALAKGPIRVRCRSCGHIWVVSKKTTILQVDEPGKETPSALARQTEEAADYFSHSLIEKLTTLRALVGFLGEKQQYGWWDTNFLSQTGQEFLNIIFPRSAFAAGINSVTEAARRLHDSRIGKGGVYHLFRLPAGFEQVVHEDLFDFNLSEVLSHFKEKEAALERLQAIAGNHLEASEGPIQIGIDKDLMRIASIKKLAKYYAHAFGNEIQAFPYFTE